jgi:hypothetical protein
MPRPFVPEFMQAAALFITSVTQRTFAVQEKQKIIREGNLNALSSQSSISQLVL